MGTFLPIRNFSLYNYIGNRRAESRLKNDICLRISSFSPSENWRSPGKISIFRLKIHIFRLQIRIFRLQIYIFSLKIEI